MKSLEQLFEFEKDERRMPHVKVDENACMGCMNCVKTCIYEVYKWNSEKNITEALYEEECVACLQCELNCPAGAITVIPPELAFFDPIYDAINIE